MKNCCLIFALLISIFSYSQDEILYEFDWRLNGIGLDGQDYFPPNNRLVGLVFENEAETLSAFVCSNLNGSLLFDDPNQSFTFPEGINIAPIKCDDSDDTTFEELYFKVFSDNLAESFSYEIYLIDFPPGYGLFIYTPNGDYVDYYDYYLTTPQNSFINNIYTYPNPVNDKLYISSTTENDLSIVIYDITGKLILSDENKKTGGSINVQHLKSGIYFVSLKDETGNTSIKRIIKN